MSDALRKVSFVFLLNIVLVFFLWGSHSHGFQIQQIIFFLSANFISIIILVGIVIRLIKRISIINGYFNILMIYLNENNMLSIKESQLSTFLETQTLSDKLVISSDESTFKYYRTNTPVLVKLYNDRIEFFYKIKTSFSGVPNFILFISDIVGSKLCQDVTEQDKNNVFIEIFAYPKEKYLSQVQSKRKRQSIKLSCCKFSNVEENTNIVNLWHSTLRNVLQSSKDASQDPNNNSFLASGPLKPFLFYVNPKAGAKKAEKIFHNQILPVLTEANIPYKLVITTHPNFAREHIKTLKLDDYQGLIVVSGDGLIYEVLNGLMECSDWEKAIKTPIAQVPGGSANALACCASYLANETYRKISLESFATSSTFSLIKSQTVPLDLMKIQLENNCVLPSFLSLEWAFIADLDLESERYRFLGDMRFTVGALQRILNLRIYKGRVSFLPSDDMKDYKPKDSSIKITRNNSDNHKKSSNSKQQDNSFKYLRSFDEPVPSDWLIIEDEFILFLIVNLPLISPDFLASPHATFNDGNMHLLFLKAGATKTQLLKLLTQPGDRHHLDNPLMEFVKIKAFRLEPVGIVGDEGNNGVLMVDGEQVPYGKIQGEICPGLGRTLIHKNK